MPVIKGSLYKERLRSSSLGQSGYSKNKVITITNTRCKPDRKGQETDWVWYKVTDTATKKRYYTNACTGWFLMWFDPMTPIEIAKYRIENESNPR